MLRVTFQSISMILALFNLHFSCNTIFNTVYYLFCIPDVLDYGPICLDSMHLGTRDNNKSFWYLTKRLAIVQSYWNWVEFTLKPWMQKLETQRTANAGFPQQTGKCRSNLAGQASFRENMDRRRFESEEEPVHKSRLSMLYSNPARVVPDWVIPELCVYFCRNWNCFLCYLHSWTFDASPWSFQVNFSFYIWAKPSWKKNTDHCIVYFLHRHFYEWWHCRAITTRAGQI